MRRTRGRGCVCVWSPPRGGKGIAGGCPPSLRSESPHAFPICVDHCAQSVCCDREAGLSWDAVVVCQPMVAGLLFPSWAWLRQQGRYMQVRVVGCAR